jgi:hypothetical protein
MNTPGVSGASGGCALRWGIASPLPRLRLLDVVGAGNAQGTNKTIHL